jgi:hypothetical protein
MFDVIREFLLVPALLTVGLLLIPAVVADLVLRRVGQPSCRRPGWWRHPAFLICGEAGTLVAILLFYSLSVLRGLEGLRYGAWGASFIIWLLASLIVSRPSRATVAASAFLALAAFLVDTWITETILFE